MPRRERARRRGALGAALGAALAIGGCGEGGEGGETGGGTGGAGGTSGTTGGTSGGGPPAPQPSTLCESAPTVEIGRYQGSLRGVGGDPIGVCGGGGPMMFLRVEIPTRADLRVAAEGVGVAAGVAVLADGCAPRREIACAGAGPLVVPDLLAGQAVLVAIGAAADDPGLGAPPGEGPDPLGFTVDVGLTEVLDVGAPCGPGTLGRCPTGTQCAPSAESPGGPPMCEALVGDTCAAPEVVALHGLAGSIAVDPGAPQSDAHAHACFGEGARERVLRLELDPTTPFGVTLTLSAPGPGVGLAARGPGCAAADAIGCAAPGAGGASLTIDEPAAYLGARGPYVFVELDDAVSDPFALSWSIALK